MFHEDSFIQLLKRQMVFFSGFKLLTNVHEDFLKKLVKKEKKSSFSLAINRFIKIQDNYSNN